MKYVAGGVAAKILPSLISSASAQTPASPAAAPETFDWGSVVETARTLSKRPFRAPAVDLPDPFANLTYEQYSGIRNLPGTAVWAEDNVGFAIEPLHRGFAFATQVQIALIEDGKVLPLAYRTSDYDFGGLKVPADLKDIGFSGFRILQTRDKPANEIAIFQGASFFRAIGRGQTYGVTARGLSVRTADPKGEEFPAFRSIWIEKPTLATNALVIYAVLESESITGAYRFTFRGGEATISDTECTLFPRVNIDNVGLGAMTATHVAGPLDRRRTDDVRPSIFDMNGLQMLNGRGEWIWRPVSNRETLQISAFQDENPRGFGFLQRDRDFGRFLDDERHWEQHPSLWIEPIGDWGPGSVNLVEIPSDSEVNQNIVAYWRPKNPLAAGTEISFAYRQFWCWSPPERPNLATVSISRAGRPTGSAANARRRRFLVQFSGDGFAEIERGQDVFANLWVGPGNILGAKSILSPDRKAFRVVFDVEAGNEPVMELRLQLEYQGKPISETWLYRWTS